MDMAIVKQVLEVSFAGGAFSLVVWVVQRTFKVTIPRLADDFKASLENQQKTYREDMKEARELFREELERERKTLQEILTNERASHERIMERIEHLVSLMHRLESRL